jgi:hypothetical protein
MPNNEIVGFVEWRMGKSRVNFGAEEKLLVELMARPIVFMYANGYRYSIKPRYLLPQRATQAKRFNRLRTCDVEVRIARVVDIVPRTAPLAPQWRLEKSIIYPSISQVAAALRHCPT